MIETVSRGGTRLRRRLIMLLALAGVALTASACGQRETAPSAIRQVNAVIDWKPDTTYIGFLVAREKGLYAAHGLNVNLLYGNGAITTATAIGTGRSAEIGSASAEATAIVRSHGVPVRSVGVIYQEVPTVLYSLATSPVRAPKDLLGKRIGLVAGSIGVNEFDALLAANAIPAQAVQVIFGGTSPAQLLQHSVDALESYEEAEALQVKLQGYPIVTMRLADHGVDAYGLNIVASDALIRRDPALVRAFVAATLEGYNWTRAHPDEAAALYLKLFPEHDPAFVRASIRVVNTHLGAGEVGAQSPARWGAMIALLHTLGVISNPPSVADVVAADPGGKSNTH